MFKNIVKNIWVWLSKNSKSFGSIASIISIIGFSLAIFLYITSPFSNLFKSVEILSYQSNNSLVIQNQYNDDVFVTDIITELKSNDGWNTIGNRVTNEVVSQNSISVVKLEEDNQYWKYYSGDANFSDLNIDDSCYKTQIMSKDHPTIDFILKSTDGNSRKKPSAGEARVSVRYILGKKTKEITIPSYFFYLVKKECLPEN